MQSIMPMHIFNCLYLKNKEVYWHETVHNLCKNNSSVNFKAFRVRKLFGTFEKQAVGLKPLTSDFRHSLTITQPEIKILFVYVT